MNMKLLKNTENHPNKNVRINQESNQDPDK